MTAPAGPDGTALAALVAQVSRELRGSLPAPKGAPFFGLDSGLAFSPSVLESLSRPGIFRKYELVLLLGGGCGGEARWLASRLGCHIVDLGSEFDSRLTASLLNERAHARDRVAILCGNPLELPVRGGSFTHVWFVGPPPGDIRIALAEAFRALRPAGQLALQLQAPPDSQECAAIAAVCQEVGFEAIDRHPAIPAELPPAFRLARLRMRRAASERWGRCESDPWQAAAAPPAVVVQLYARRPS